MWAVIPEHPPHFHGRVDISDSWNLPAADVACFPCVRYFGRSAFGFLVGFLEIPPPLSLLSLSIMSFILSRNCGYAVHQCFISVKVVTRVIVACLPAWRAGPF